MDYLTGSTNSWHPVMTANTTSSSYWLNWRVLVCSIWILTSMLLSFLIISKHEGPRNSRTENGELQKDKESGLLYEDELWKPCLKGIHPAWLLASRLVSFLVLLIMLSLNVAVDGSSILEYYTQWTFTLVTLYFGLGSLLSIYGCYKYHNKVGGDGMRNLEANAEQGTRGALEPTAITNVANSAKRFRSNEACRDRQMAGFWGYVFQVIFQMNAGAVMLTDFVFWFVIVPFLTRKDYDLNVLLVNMHSVNAVFLLGEASLNSMRFPWFRIAYFFLWTTAYVIFQWIFHSVISTWWPYPFLDLSDSFAPLWYSSVALLHIPCYGVFALLMKLKHHLLSRNFPESYEGVH